MEALAVVLGFAAGIMHLVAFGIYNKQILQKTSHPNSATWMLWVFLTVLNFTSYFYMSGDWVKSLLPTASSIACILTFILALFKGKLKRPKFWDSVALTIGLIAGGMWWYYNSAIYANLILQGAVAISFIPTYRDVWKDPKTEKALPWFIWAGAYVFSLVVVGLRWQEQYVDLVYPVSCLVLHAVVGVLARRTRG